MSDFGSEVGNSTVQVSANVLAKLLDAITGLFRKVYETWEDSRNPESRLALKQLKGIKDEARKNEKLERIRGSVGYVNHKKLEMAGVPLTSTGVKMSKEDFSDLAAHCKREGIIISAIVDSRELSINKRKLYIVECKQSDLKRLEELTYLLNDEKRIENIDNKIYLINSKGKSNLTEQDEIDLYALNEEREQIQMGYCHGLNDEQASGIIEDFSDVENKRGVSLNEALNRNTGGHIDKDVHCIVADAYDPSNYIKCHGYKDTYNDKPYIKTEYEVYKGGNKVYTTHDGRFNGRPKDYWDNQKKDMIKAGGIGDVVFKFYSESEYDKYVRYYKSQNSKTLDIFKDTSGANDIDYDSILATLTNQLDELGVSPDYVYFRDRAKSNALQDGTLYDIDTGNPLRSTNSYQDLDKIKITEANIIFEQITNYERLKELETELVIKKADALSKEGTPLYDSAINNYNDSLDEYNNLYLVSESLIKDREKINAVYAENESREQSNREREMKTRPGTAYEEKPDDKRSERIDEIGNEKAHDIEEYKGKIEDIKINKGDNKVDMKDKDLNKESVPKLKAVRQDR